MINPNLTPRRRQRKLNCLRFDHNRGQADRNRSRASILLLHDQRIHSAH